MDLKAAAEILRDVPCDCENCGRTAHVGPFDRFSGKWTCYSCGRVNTFEEDASAKPTHRKKRKGKP
jgi:transposase-like protein